MWDEPWCATVCVNCVILGDRVADVVESNYHWLCRKFQEKLWKQNKTIESIVNVYFATNTKRVEQNTHKNKTCQAKPMKIGNGIRKIRRKV